MHKTFTHDHIELCYVHNESEGLAYVLSKVEFLIVPLICRLFSGYGFDIGKLSNYMICFSIVHKVNKN